MSLRTLPDMIVPLPKFKMAAFKPEVEITFELREMVPRFQLLPPPHIFGLARLEYDTVDIARHCQMLADYRQST
jgi:hypothetical protein